jgi:hypothetical protein
MPKKPNQKKKDSRWGARQEANKPLAAKLTFDRRLGKWVEAKP